MLGVPVVVLAKILRKILIGMPIDVMSPAPDLRVRLRIIDRRFILQRVVVWTRDPLDQMESIGMRQPEARHPELFVEAHSVDHQRIAVPMADGVSQEAWVQLIGGWVWTAVRIHDTPGMRAAAG